MHRSVISQKERAKIYLRDKGKCVDCGRLCGGGWTSNWSGRVHTFGLNGTHEIHHIIPVSKKGETAPANLILLCLNCHKKRHRIEGVLNGNR